MITIDYTPVGAAGNLAIQGGLGEYAKVRRQFGQDDARLGMQQQGINLQAQSQANQMFLAQQEMAQRAQEAEANRQAQMQQNWQQMQARQYENAQQNAMAMLQDQARQRQQNAVDNRLDQRQMWSWQQEGSDSIEKQVALQQAEMSKLAPKLTPDGLGKYRELATALRGIQATRAGTPPEKYAKALTQWQDEFDRSGVASMVNEPSPLDDRWYGENVFKKDGITYLKQPDGKVTHVVEKPEKAAPPPPPDLSSDDAKSNYAKSLIVNHGGVDYQIDPKTYTLKALPKPPPADPFKGISSRVKLENEIAKRLYDEQPEPPPIEGIAQLKAPITQEQIQAEIARRLGPEVSAAREYMKQKGPEQLPHFDSLTPEEKAIFAKGINGIKAQGGAKPQPAAPPVSRINIGQQVGPPPDQSLGGPATPPPAQVNVGQAPVPQAPALAAPAGPVRVPSGGDMKAWVLANVKVGQDFILPDGSVRTRTK